MAKTVGAQMVESAFSAYYYSILAVAIGEAMFASDRAELNHAVGWTALGALPVSFVLAPFLTYASPYSNGNAFCDQWVLGILGNGLAQASRFLGEECFTGRFDTDYANRAAAHTIVGGLIVLAATLAFTIGCMACCGNEPAGPQPLRPLTYDAGSSQSFQMDRSWSPAPPAKSASDAMSVVAVVKPPVDSKDVELVLSPGQAHDLSTLVRDVERADEQSQTLG